MRRCSPYVLAMVLLAAGALVAAEQKFMSLQVRKGEVRSTPSYLGNVVAVAAYGDRFAVLEEKGQWLRVSGTTSNVTGWIHASALTKATIKVAAGDKNAQLGASSGELALAGKGFNSDVESSFKKQNGDLNYAAVDRIERAKVSPEEMKQFLAEGDVRAEKGGAQ